MNLLKPAGLVLRLAAWILDLILIGIMSLKLGRYEVGLVLGPTSIDTNAQAAAVILLVVWMNLILFHLIEIASGGSPAKWILGLQVRRPDGGSVGMGRRIIRCLGNVIPLMLATGLAALQSYMPIGARALLGALLLLGLAPLCGPMKQPLPDLLAGTVLVRR